MAGREKTFTCVAFSDELFVLGTQLVPKDVEWFVVRAMDNMAESAEGREVLVSMEIIVFTIGVERGRYSYSCSIVSTTSSRGMNCRSSCGYRRRRQIF